MLAIPILEEYYLPPSVVLNDGGEELESEVEFLCFINFSLLSGMIIAAIGQTMIEI